MNVVRELKELQWHVIEDLLFVMMSIQTYFLVEFFLVMVQYKIKKQAILDYQLLTKIKMDSFNKLISRKILPKLSRQSFGLHGMNAVLCDVLFHVSLSIIKFHDHLS